MHINSKMRAILLDWIVLVAYKYKQVRAGGHVSCGQACVVRAGMCPREATMGCVWRPHVIE